MAGVSFLGLSNKQRSASAKSLASVMYSLEDLMHQCKTASMNTRGLPERYAIDELCDWTCTHFKCVADCLAERMCLLGEEIDYTVEAIQKGSNLKPFPLGLKDPVKVFQTVGESWRAVLQLVREEAVKADKSGDLGTAALLCKELCYLEKHTKKMLDIVSAYEPLEAIEFEAMGKALSKAGV